MYMGFVQIANKYADRITKTGLEVAEKMHQNVCVYGLCKSYYEHKLKNSVVKMSFSLHKMYIKFETS